MKDVVLAAASLLALATPCLTQIETEVCPPFSFVLNLTNECGPDDCTATLTSGTGAGLAIADCGGCVASASLTVRCPTGIATISDVYAGECNTFDGGVSIPCPSGTGSIGILNMSCTDCE